MEIIPNIYKRRVVSDGSGPIFTVDASLVKLKKMDARLPELNPNVYISRTRYNSQKLVEFPICKVNLDMFRCS